MKKKISGILALCLLCGALWSGVAQAAVITHTVKSGETLWTISKMYGTTLDEVRRLNNIYSDVLSVGQLIKVADNTGASQSRTFLTYKVAKGDTLGKIGEKFGCDYPNIIEINGLKGTMIYVDQLLKIPADYEEYYIKKGDTLYLLAKQYGTTIDRIKMFSGITSDALDIGQKLAIPKLSSETPPPVPSDTAKPTVTYTTYTIVKGDDAWSISIKFGIPMSELLSVNKLTEASILNIGQKLTIPVHHIPIKPTPGPKYGEYLDWWTEGQYVFPIGATGKVTDMVTGKSFNIKRTIGACHADCEPLTAVDAATMKTIWGGYSWNTRACILEVNGRRVATSLSNYPHGIKYISGNNYDGHFDLYMANCLRHVDNKPDPAHDAKVKQAAGK